MLFKILIFAAVLVICPMILGYPIVPCLTTLGDLLNYPTALRIQGCDSSPCHVNAGASVAFEMDFINDFASPSLNLRLNASTFGVWRLLDIPKDKINACNGLVGSTCPVADNQALTHAGTVPISTDYHDGVQSRIQLRILNTTSIGIQGCDSTVALIGYRDGDTVRSDCGGTLISEQFVLSAAQCVNALEFGPAMYVRLGEHDLSRTDEAAHVDLNIIQRIPHPDYKYPLLYNDIGLLKLERKVQLNVTIRSACLPEQSAVLTRKAIATGWGAVAWRGSRSNVLIKVTLEMFSQLECDSSYRTFRKLNKGIVEETQVCAGSKKEVKDTCEGDSGGPLQINHPTHFCTYTIVGVTSFGKACATVGTPGLYTRVYAYLSWIEGIVWPNEK